jgi:hypothetical protein
MTMMKTHIGEDGMATLGLVNTFPSMTRRVNRMLLFVGERLRTTIYYL